MSNNTAGGRLDELFRSHYDHVLAYCARRIGRSEAEDAAAEVFATATRRVEEIDWATVRPWLFGIARLVLANRWRSINRRRRVLARVAGLAGPVAERPEELVIRRADEGEAIKVLHRMSPGDQEVLMLAAWEELTGPEIAVALGISLGAAEQRLHRAKQRFARTLLPAGNQARAAGLSLNDEGGSR